MRFGQIAVEQGFLSPQQVQEAITEQIEEDLSHKPHRLIGEICLEKGWLTPRQIEIVLDEIVKQKKKKEN
jgi:Tat protein secretion system quality control protein TatD with DNase activity